MRCLVLSRIERNRKKKEIEQKSKGIALQTLRAQAHEKRTKNTEKKRLEVYGFCSLLVLFLFSFYSFYFLLNNFV